MENRLGIGDYETNWKTGFPGARSRATAFCERYGLKVPILQAPMAGSCPPGLAAAVANAG
jgi:hypothetical protein